VYVCTPPRTHAEVVERIIETFVPKAIFVEKPLATSMYEATKITDLTRSRGVLGMVGFQKRYNYVFGETKKLIERGEVGEVLFFRSHSFTSSVLYPTASGWRHEPESGGAILEWGIHLVDLVLWIFGRPSSVVSQRYRVFSERVEDHALASLSFPGGLWGTVEVGWSLRQFNPPGLAIEIHGTKGTIVVDEDRLTIYRAGDVKDGIGGRPRPLTVHTSSVTPEPAFRLGQPENYWEEVSFQESIDAGAVLTNTFQESVSIHEVLDSMRRTPLK
jgi:predicted dehydrogenase